MQLKSKLAQSEITIGSWITLGHPSIAEIMATAGFDWLVLDMEHSVLELSEIQMLIQVLDMRKCPAIVRLTSNHPDQIKRVMDAGANGIMVPMIKSAADAEAAVQSVYYPPRGKTWSWISSRTRLRSRISAVQRLVREECSNRGNDRTYRCC